MLVTNVFPGLILILAASPETNPSYGKVSPPIHYNSSLYGVVFMWGTPAAVSLLEVFSELVPHTVALEIQGGSQWVVVRGLPTDTDAS